MVLLSKEFLILLWIQETASEKIIGTIHGLSVHDLRKGHMETHVEVLSLFVHTGHGNLS